MAVKPIQINNLVGGMNTGDPTTIENNEFASLRNMFYDQDNVLTTRRGAIGFGEPVPDAVVLVDACDATTDWSVTDDATTLAAGTAIRGSNSISFAIDVSNSGNDFATLTKAAGSTVDISSAKGYLSLWLYVPAAFNTNLTGVTLHLGSSTSDYYEWTLPTLTEDSNNWLQLPYSDATTTGTPNDAAVDHIELQVTYDASYTDKTGILLDAIYSYSATSLAPQHSLQEHETSTGTMYLLCGCGTNIFEYRATSQAWEVIKTGLTDGQRFDSAMFKDVVYITNGVDNYMSYNGTAVSEHAGTEKGTMLVVANDVAYLAGVAADASTVYYTNANPTNLQSFANFEPINEDDGQKITGLAVVGPLVVVYKERSAYIFDSATPSVQNVDYDGGLTNHRAQARVENENFFHSAEGIVSLAQREGTTGALRGLPRSRQIQAQLDDLYNTNKACAIYWPAANHFYFAVDDENSGENRTIYVYNTTVEAWTFYKGLNANEFCIHRLNDGTESLLAANPYGGQTIQLETGFVDPSGTPISWEIITKSYDFGEYGRLILYPRVDLGGAHSEQSSAAVAVEVFSASKLTKNKTVAYQASTDRVSPTSLGTFGSKTLGSTPMGGGAGGGSGLTLWPFFRYMPVNYTGRLVRLKISGSAENSAFALTNINVHPVPLDVNTVPQAMYI